MAFFFLCCLVQMLLSFKAEPCKDCGTEFEHTYVLEGEAVYLSCPVCDIGIQSNEEELDTGYNFTWYKNGSNVPPTANNTSRILAEQNTIGFFPARAGDSGFYECVKRSVTRCWKKRVALDVYHNDNGLCYNKSVMFRQNLSTCRGACIGDNLVCPGLSDFVTQELAQVKWYKECEHLKTNGSRFKASGFQLRIDNLTKGDEGHYLCQISYIKNGDSFHVSRVVELDVKVTEEIIPPVIIYPKDERLYVNIDSSFMLTCNVSYTTSDPPSFYWKVNDVHIQDFFENSNRAIFEEPFSSTLPDGSKVFTLRINISEVKVEDYSVKYFCVLGNTERYISLQPPPSHTLGPLIACILALAFVIVVAIAAYKLFKVDIVLCYRNSFSQLVQAEQLDGKLYDACVTFLKDSNSNPIHPMSLFVLKCIPEVLEKNCGYKLFIYGRDDLPGEAVANVIAQTVEKSRRLIMVLTGNKLTEDIWHTELEQHVALYDALINNKTKIILIEMEKIDYMEMSESFRFIRRKHGAIRWKGDFTDQTLSPNTRFWKKVRYYMPPGKHKPSSNDFTSLSLV